MNSAYRIQDLFTLPGWLSLSRVGLAVCFPLVVSSPWLALSVVAAAAVSDMLDGYVARRLHQNTPMGAALDPVTDKIFASSVMLTLLCADRLSITGAVLMSARELGELPLLLWMLVHPRARHACAERLRANYLGKLTTALQFGALLGVLFGAASSGWWFAATAVVGSLAAGAYWLSCLSTLTGRQSVPIQPRARQHGSPETQGTKTNVAETVKPGR